MTTLYRIRDWDKHFECNRTRSVKRLEWVTWRCNLDDDGYIALMARPDGLRHLGAFAALVEVAARCRPRGTLLRDTGIPHDQKTVSVKARCPEEHVAEALEVLSAPDIAWVERIPLSPEDLDESGRVVRPGGAQGCALRAQGGDADGAPSCPTGQDKTGHNKQDTRGLAPAEMLGLWNEHRGGLPRASMSADRSKRLRLLAKEALGRSAQHPEEARLLVAATVLAFAADAFNRQKRHGIDTLLRHRVKWLDFGLARLQGGGGGLWEPEVADGG